MRIIVQRVNRAAVRIDGAVVGQIGQGMALLIGFTHTDDRAVVERGVDKCVHLRIFEDAEGKMNRSVLETGGSVLAISQFTLYGDAGKGRRPSFVDAARPEAAEPLYHYFVACLRDKGVPVQTGVFGAMMEVEIQNWGPVTILLET